MQVSGRVRERRPTAAIATRITVEHGRAIGKLVLAFQPRAGHGIGDLDVAIAAWTSDQLSSDFAAHYLFSGFGTRFCFYSLSEEYS